MHSYCGVQYIKDGKEWYFEFIDQALPSQRQQRSSSDSFSKNRFECSQSEMERGIKPWVFYDCKESMS